MKGEWYIKSGQCCGTTVYFKSGRKWFELVHWSNGKETLEASKRPKDVKPLSKVDTTPHSNFCELLEAK